MRSLFIHIFPLIRLLTVCGYAIELPFHAHSHNNTIGWICNNGFFQTKPANLQLSTCKRCSPLNASQCPQDSTFSVCTPFADAFCKKCPRALPPGWEYTPGTNDCQTKRCTKGFYYSSLTNETCLACPVGSYCDGKREECGPWLTTLSQEQSNPLSCIPTHYDALHEIQFHLSFSVLAFMDKPFCSTKNTLLSRWLSYGRLIDCTATKGPNSGDMVCIILIAKRFTAPYLAWFYKEITIQTQWMKTFLVGCIQQPEAVISAWDISVSDKASGDSLMMYTITENSTAKKRGNTSVALIKTGPPWGSQSQDVAFFLFTVIMLGSAMCMSIALLMVGIILRIRKRRGITTMLESQVAMIKNRL